MKKIFCLSVFALISLLILPSVQAADVLVQNVDEKSGVGYTVIADDASLVMAFDFSGPIRLMQMANNGFQVYINPNGKKKTEQGLQVLGLRPERPQGMKEGFNPGEQPQRPADGERPKFEFPEKMDFKQGSWFNGSDTTAVVFNEEGSGFKAYLDRADEKNRCVVIIPLDAINMDGKELKDIMVGLVSEPSKRNMPDFSKGERNGQRPEGFPAGEGFEGRFQGPPPGAPGMGPGMGGPGMGSGMRPGGNFPGGQNRPSMKIEVWFKCR